MSDRSKRADSTPGLNNIKRDAIGTVMGVLTKFTGSDLAEKYGCLLYTSDAADE